MNPVVTISGGGIIGNYISLRLNQSSIESVVIEKSKNKISANKNIRTVTLNPYSKKLLDDVGIKIPYAMRASAEQCSIATSRINFVKLPTNNIFHNEFT